MTPAESWRACLVVLFLVLAAVYHVFVPLGEGPDEPGHMRYVLFLAREQRLPVQAADHARSDVPGEGHQPPLAYLLALPTVLWLPDDAQQLSLSVNPDFLWNSGSEPDAFFRASSEYWPWQGVTLAWHLARGISTVWGAITIVCVWQAARLVVAPRQGAPPGAHRQAEYTALLAAALLATNPQFLFTSALVTNDMLLAALSAGLFWLCLAAVRRATTGPLPPLRAHLLLPLAAGVLFGLALLTKQSALLLAPLPLWAFWNSSRENWRRTMLLALVWGGVVLLLAGWWFVRNWQLYGDPAGLAAFQATYATQPFEWRSPAAWGSALQQLYASFWARFGWLSLRPPAWVLWIYTLLVCAALVGLLRMVLEQRQQIVHSLSPWQIARSPWAAVVLLPLLALAWVVSFALAAGLVAWQGRMLFPALAAIAVGLAWGLVRLCAPWSARRVLFAVGVPLFALALYLPPAIIDPAYDWHTLPPAVAQSRIEHPTYARYAKPWEQGVELRGWRIHTDGQQSAADQTIRAGDTLSLTLTWHALEQIEHNWTVFVHLVDDSGRIVTEHNSIPQQGGFPMPAWTPGDWLEDSHTLRLPADLPPGTYRLRVGLYLPWQRDPQEGRRQEVWNRAGKKIGDFAEIGTIQVVAGSEAAR
jgi:hypothetical protein